jgi:hypothetical protein
VTAEIPDAFQNFADTRGRVAVFCFTPPESISLNTVLRIHDELGDTSYEELDLVIHSGGGSAHAAYQLMSLLRMHAKAVYACVPFWAKSAATLLCVGSDKIVLGDHAELGPLDVQIWEEKKKGEGEFHSALDPFKALEQAQAFSSEALANTVSMLVREYGLSYDDALTHAVRFVDVTTGPLVRQLDPEKLGQYSRELQVASEYGQRLLARTGKLPPREAGEVIDQIIYGYPSHDYVIDFPELQALGFPVELFDDAGRAVVREMRSLVEGPNPETFISAVEPMPADPTEATQGNGPSTVATDLTTSSIQGRPDENPV